MLILLLGLKNNKPMLGLPYYYQSNQPTLVSKRSVCRWKQQFSNFADADRKLYELFNSPKNCEYTITAELSSNQFSQEFKDEFGEICLEFEDNQMADEGIQDNDICVYFEYGFAEFFGIDSKKISKAYPLHINTREANNLNGIHVKSFETPLTDSMNHLIGDNQWKEKYSFDIITIYWATNEYESYED